jgi:hypothetical protein
MNFPQKPEQTGPVFHKECPPNAGPSHKGGAKHAIASLVAKDLLPSDSDKADHLPTVPMRSHAHQDWRKAALTKMAIRGGVSWAS